MKKNKVMTPKDKAEQLVLKMLRIENNTQEWFHKGLAKQCALIAVDEVIEQEKNWIRETGKGNSNYYKQVKQEIEKL